MIQQRTPQPIDEYAAIIYECFMLSPSDDTEALVLQYRDQLTKLVHQGEQDRAFVAYFDDSMSPSAIPEPNTIVSDAFDAARDALQGEQLASLDPTEIHRQLDQHLRHISRTLAQEFVTALKRELDAGHIGQILTVGESIGRCKLPARAGGNQYNDPLAEMTIAPEDDEEQPSFTVDFFYEQDVLLTDARRMVRQFRPLQLILKRASRPLRHFLRLVTGKRYKDSGELATGRITAVVLFDYVLDFWTDDDRPVHPTPTRPQSNRLWQLLRRFPIARASAISLLALIAIVVVVIGLDYRQALQVDDLQQQVRSLEEAFTNDKQHSAEPASVSPEVEQKESVPIAALERRLDALEEHVRELSLPVDSDQTTTVTDRLAEQIAAIEARLPTDKEDFANAHTVTERFKALDEQLLTGTQTIDQRLVLLSNRIETLEHDTTQHDQFVELKRQTSGDRQLLREDIGRLRGSLKTTNAYVTTLRTTAATTKQLASVQGQATSNTTQLRAELFGIKTRLDTTTSTVTKRLNALDKLLSGDTDASGRSTARSVAQMRYRIQHTPSQRVVDELHRLINSDEPHEVRNRSNLIAQRWELLWTASASVPYATRATMLLQEIVTLSKCKNLPELDTHLCKQFKLLSLLPPEGERVDMDALITLTIQARTFFKSDNSYYSTHDAKDYRTHLVFFVSSVGAFVEKQRIAELKETIDKGNLSPDAVTESN